MLLNFGRTRSPGRSSREMGDGWTPSSEGPAATHRWTWFGRTPSGALRLIDTLVGSPNSRYVQRSAARDSNAICSAQSPDCRSAGINCNKMPRNVTLRGNTSTVLNTKHACGVHPIGGFGDNHPGETLQPTRVPGGVSGQRPHRRGARSAGEARHAGAMARWPQDFRSLFAIWRPFLEPSRRSNVARSAISKP